MYLADPQVECSILAKRAFPRGGIGLGALGRKRTRAGLHGLGQFSPSDLASMVAAGDTLSSEDAAAWNALPASTRASLLEPYVQYAAKSGAKYVDIPSLAQATWGIINTAPATTPAGVSARSTPQPGVSVTSTPQQISTWLNQRSIAGIPNSYLLAAAVGLGVVLALAKKR